MPTQNRGTNTHQHYEELRPVLMERFGFTTLTDYDIAELERIALELKMCADCKGECTKKVSAYYVPRIVNVNGQMYTSRRDCEYGLQRRLKKGCKLAAIPEKYVGKTLGDYEVTSDNREAVGMAQWLIKEKPDKGLYFWGECGTGKTYLAALIAQEYLRAYKTVIFGDVPELMQEIKRTFDKGDTQDLLDRYCECDLLIMDDMGAGRLTDWNVGMLYEIVNRRYKEGKAIIATSNFDLESLKKQLSKVDTLAGKRIVSRLSGMCEVAYFGEVDRRRKR